MRLLNSVCKVLADAYTGVPIHIKEVPQFFERPCFFIQLVTDPKQIKSYNMIQLTPTYQIVYFGERDEANQAIAEPLYEVQDRMEELFLYALAVPVIPKEGETPDRFAKIETFTSDLRLGEGAIYCNLTINFTENIPHEVETVTIDTVSVDIW